MLFTAIICTGLHCPSVMSPMQLSGAKAELGCGLSEVFDTAYNAAQNAGTINHYNS